MHRLTLLLLSAMVALPARGDGPAPRWRQGWGLTGTAPAESAGGHAPGFAQLLLQAGGGGREAQVRNLLAGPLQVRLRDAADGRTMAAPVLLPPGGQRDLLWLADTGGGARLLLDAFPGDPSARPDDHLYQLPFAGVPVRVSQGIDGAHSHRDAQNRHAIDFPLPEGTPVLAARAGTVMQVLADANLDGCLVRVLHADGGMALYAHLQAGSLAVRPGQAVLAGQVLARSGNTGRSTGPHLHFAVQANTGLALASIPFRMAGPRGELRFARETGAPP
ncbi:M23 family metallopeptidase [Stenotrophomonas acidaminiphila]|uniref:M23 family metallopeptidase n=1 Tax=Stenotrophomonas acidaminiphila TaxID=128780 RepID=UPI001FAF4F48|nr:M23 family metallopeptidase [Stenotrophomonas acidaminiphila]